MNYKEQDLFGNEKIRLSASKRKITQTSLLDYDGFVEKFDQKKTTDDCYTPEKVYNAIVNFVSKNFNLSGLSIIRPFYPGADYETIDYQNNDIVIDNPPFSIVSKIAKFFIKNDVKFFIFAPHMTLFSCDHDASYIVCGADIVYENGAKVKTSFISNLFGDIKLLGSPELYNTLKSINEKKVELPKYQYPQNVLTVSRVQNFVEKGISFSVDKNHIKHLRQLDSQKEHKKTLFGSGFLLSDFAAEAAEAAEAIVYDKQKADIIIWRLSDRERKIIHSLGDKTTTL